MSNRDLRRSVQKADEFFNSKKGELGRGHFRHVVGFFATKHPEHQEGLAKAAGVPITTINRAINNEPTKMREDQRVAAVRYICRVANADKVEIPAGLAKRIGFAPATA